MEAKERPGVLHRLYKQIKPNAESAAAKSLYQARVAMRINAAHTAEAEVPPMVDAPVTAATAVTGAAPVAQPVSAAPLVSPATVTPVATVTPAVAAMELFGSFFLAEQEFALPAKCIGEVVKFPEKLIPIPLSPAYLEGMFTLRGMVIPVVSLARLFNPDAAAASSEQKIAIINHEQIQIGLLFDNTGEILRVRAEQRSTLEYTAQDEQGVVAGTIQLADGARLLQILDPTALIHIENIPHVLERRALTGKMVNNRFHLQAERGQCVDFRLGGTSFAFDISAIREIIKVPALTSSVLDSTLCLGGINFRGNMIPVVDFAVLLNISDMKARSLLDQRILIARIGAVSIGFLVDSVDNIVSFFPDDVLPIPLLSKTRALMYRGCIVREGKSEIVLLDHEGIFSHAEIVAMNKGNANLYAQEGKHDEKLVNQRAQRKVYITFTVANTFAVEIKQIREIIDFPDDIIKPPGMPSFICGVMNLRRQLISLIDLRDLYGMPPLSDAGNEKILIIDHGEERYGLIVDAVDNIVTIPDSNRYPMPKIMRNQAVEDLRTEMEDVVEMPGDGTQRLTLSVFGTETFLQRLSREWQGGVAG